MCKVVDTPLDKGKVNNKSQKKSALTRCRLLVQDTQSVVDGEEKLFSNLKWVTQPLAVIFKTFHGRTSSLKGNGETHWRSPNMSFACFPAARIGKCDKALSHNISTMFTLFFSGFVLHCCCLTSQTPAHDSFSNTLAGHSTQQEATALHV